MDSSFGALLKDWRAHRRVSQFDLGLAARVSARHISFLETGRSKPSRSMVIQLSETLAVPRAARNALLNAAGFAPAYRSRDLGKEDMAAIRAAVDWTLQRHDPFPALALDRHWLVVTANRSATMMLAAFGLRTGDSLLQAITTSMDVQAAFDNWPQVARFMAVRLRTESSHLGGDEVLDKAANVLIDQVGPAMPDGSGMLPAVVPARIRANGRVLSFFSTIAQFGTAEDIALADLRIELMFPADDATRQAWLASGG